MKLTSLVLILMGMATFAFGGAIDAPEISAASATSAVALLSGCVVMIRGRRKK